MQLGETLLEHGSSITFRAMQAAVSLAVELALSPNEALDALTDELALARAVLEQAELPVDGGTRVKLELRADHEREPGEDRARRGGWTSSRAPAPRFPSPMAA